MKTPLPKPLLVMMTSGDTGKHCDIYPFGSIHEVVISEEGYRKPTGKRDTIHPDFPSKEVSPDILCKTCPSCKNRFPQDWGFTDHTNPEAPVTAPKEQICIRCYGRKNHVNSERFGAAVRAEILKELEINYGIIL